MDKNVLFIDLGLPSGTLWADRNIGANRPEESGEYYRWGEVIPCTTESPEYIFRRFSYNSKNDIATIRLGEMCKTPNYEQIEELINFCDVLWIQENSLNGIKIIGKNFNSIFIPASGYLSPNKDIIYDRGVSGFVWSSSKYINYTVISPCLCIFDKNRYISPMGRNHGLPIRPVWVNSPIKP